MLTLTIKKFWFDRILSGEKKEEYRESKAYYDARFYNCIPEMKSADAMKEVLAKKEIRFGPVKFRNGYRKNSPAFTADCSIRIGMGKPE